MRLSSLLLLTGLLIVSCRPASVSQSQHEKIATEKLGADFVVEPNSSGDYVLYKQANSLNQVQAVRFLVIEVKSGKVVVEKSYLPGYVKWASEYNIEWLDRPGMIKPEEQLSDYVQRLDVRQLKF